MTAQVVDFFRAREHYRQLRERTERCVLCRQDTGIPKNLDIRDPARYRDGFYSLCNGGQVCGSCTRKNGLRQEIEF